MNLYQVRRSTFFSIQKGVQEKVKPCDCCNHRVSLVRHKGLEPLTFASPRAFFPLQAATMLAEIHPLKFQHLQDFYLLLSFIIFYWFLAFAKNFGGKKEGNRKRTYSRACPLYRVLIPLLHIVNIHTTQYILTSKITKILRNLYA